MDLAERWRVAGLLLRRLDSVAFEALLHGAEIVVAETPEESTEINFVDLIC